MFEVVSVALQLALGIGMPIWVIRRDIRNLPPKFLARAWLDATVWSAVAAFGPLAIVVHFVRTRRSLFGVALGLGWAAATLALSAALAGLGAAWE